MFAKRLINCPTHSRWNRPEYLTPRGHQAGKGVTIGVVPNLLQERCGRVGGGLATSAGSGNSRTMRPQT